MAKTLNEPGRKKKADALIVRVDTALKDYRPTTKKSGIT